ncbi:MAG: hypothetical protein LBS94_00005 [Prevotellaceae bacterium]|jgi:hypothetical protein|nr:hypothetical protein [Prevotellaceae bacterium]
MNTVSTAGLSARKHTTISASEREQLERYGVEFDENGEPNCYSVSEWFDELDKLLIAHYGEEFRTMVNETRREWNADGIWHFDMLSEVPQGRHFINRRL